MNHDPEKTLTGPDDPELCGATNENHPVYCPLDPGHEGAHQVDFRCGPPGGKHLLIEWGDG